MQPAEHPAEFSPPTREMVVAVHGLAAHRLVMLPLVRRCRAAGYQTTNWGYRSVLKDIDSNAQRLADTLQQLDQDERIDKLHLVGHSLGCIVTRRAVFERRPTKLGRIVMVCPPNQGSHVATRLQPWLGWLSPSLRQITDRRDSFVNRLPGLESLAAEVGIIVASSDLVVAAESAQLPGTRATCVIDGMHSGILFKASTARAVIQFLRSGDFTRC